MQLNYTKTKYIYMLFISNIAIITIFESNIYIYKNDYKYNTIYVKICKYTGLLTKQFV